MAEDERILSRHYALQTVVKSGPGAFVTLVTRLFECDIVVTWFGSVYSAFNTLVAHLLRKPSVIVIGGVDVANHPEIGYGIWTSRWKAPLIRFAFRRADRLLVVDPSLGQAAKVLARYDGGNIVALPTGYDAAAWPFNGGTRDNLVLTVATIDTMRRVKVKGIDLLLAAARRMPETAFRIIGVEETLRNELSADLPRNVDVHPPIPRDQLGVEYGRAKVYCQPSLTEGLPNTLCEAMLCGCVPVGTNVGGIPTAIGSAGFLVEYGDVQGLVNAIRGAMSSSADLGIAARKKISEEFGSEKREQGLCAVIDALLDRTA